MKPVSELLPVAAAPAPSGGAIAALTPETLIAKAIEANVPVEALARLLAMRAELKREQAREAFFAALAHFQASIPAIPKRRTATVKSDRGSYQYNYADLPAIQVAIAPALRDMGLSVTFSTEHQPGGYLVTCWVHHTAGHSEQTPFFVPLDPRARMNDAQKAGAALTYGRRYALCAALGIVTAEDDDDGNGADSPPAGVTPPGHGPRGSAPPVQPNGAPISAAQHRLLEHHITEFGLDRERVKTWVQRAWGVAHLTEVPAINFGHLLYRIQLWADQAAAAEAAELDAAERLNDAEQRHWANN